LIFLVAYRKLTTVKEYLNTIQDGHFKIHEDEADSCAT
jgi:hypothetical protein